MNEIYYKTPLEEVITINKIITIHYFEFAKDYVFNGEKHNFWEFLYVDNGEVEIISDTQGYKLEHGDIVFHKPNEFHSVWANGKIAPNIVVISFECDSSAMCYFENKILKLPMENRELLGKIIKEGKSVYSNNFGVIYNKLNKLNNVKFGSEQLIKLYLQMFLIELIRNDITSHNKERLSSSTKERMENDIVDNIVQYLKNNIEKNFTLDEICSCFYVGKTYLKILFKNRTGMGVMSYFRMLKMQYAKKLIREGNYNFTEIAQILGYESIHYFSRVFKNYTNMSPSEYMVSVKAKAQL